MASIEHSGVVKGALFPGKADALKIAEKIQTDIRTNPTVAAHYKANPRATLAAYGLNTDLQNEFLHDAGTKAGAEEICIFTDCIHTCWFTKCYVTRIVIEKD
jgi:hypothetical protein